jgi:hypothetical protein
MYAIHGKHWLHDIGEFLRPALDRLGHLFKSPRIWAIAGLAFTLALILFAIAAIVMLALWATTMDLSNMTPGQLIN